MTSAAGEEIEMPTSGQRAAALQWWLAYSLFGVFLLLPGPTSSPFSGLTLSAQGTALFCATLILAIFTAFFRPLRAPRPLWSALLLAAIVAKVVLALLLVPAGWRAEYSTSKQAADGHLLPRERAWFQWRGVARQYRVDPVIDYDGTSFGLPFINDPVLNDQPVQRDLAQPILVHWTGYLALDRPEQFTIAAGASGGLEIVVDGKQRLNAESPQSATTSLRLGSGDHRIDVVYDKPAGQTLSARVLLAAPVTAIPAGVAHLRRDRMAAVAIRGLGILALLALLAAFLDAYNPLRTLLGAAMRLHPDRLAALLFAAVAIAAGVYLSTPFRHTTIQLGAGDDPLAYETNARLIVRNGLPMRNDDGTGSPYFFYPLYSYALAAAHIVFGDDTSTIFLFNLLCIAAVGPLMWGLLRGRLPRGSIIAALLVTGLFATLYLYPYATNAFTDNLFVPMVLAVLLVNIEALTRRSLPLIFLTGALTALGAATRPSLLIHVPFVMLLLLLYRDLGSLARRAAAVAIFLAGFIVAIAPFTFRNWLVTGRFVLLVNNYITFPNYLVGPGDVLPPLTTHGMPGFLEAIAQFMQIFATRPLHYAWVETCKVLFTLGLTQFGPPDVPVPRTLIALTLLFAFALWRRRIDKPVAWTILAFCASHMAAMLAATPYTYGYKTILPFHLALLAGAAFLLKFTPRRAAIVTPRVRKARKR
jgi:Dolichyl-phosphate-mannose-protein mannosyltransferase